MADRAFETSQWTGRQVVDPDGEVIGIVDEVRQGDLAEAPLWLVIRGGLLGTKRVLMPAGNVSEAGDRLVVPFDRPTVENAPEVEHQGALVWDEEVRLCSYYGLDLASIGEGPIEGCPEGSGDFPT